MVTINMKNFDDSGVDKFTIDEWSAFTKLLEKLSDAELHIKRTICITEN